MLTDRVGSKRERNKVKLDGRVSEEAQKARSPSVARKPLHLNRQRKRLTGKHGNQEMCSERKKDHPERKQGRLKDPRQGGMDKVNSVQYLRKGEGQRGREA